MSEKVTMEEFVALSESIFAKKRECEELDEQLTLKNKELSRMEMKCVEVMKELGLTTFKSPHGSLTPSERTSFTVPRTPEDRAAFFDYLKGEGLFENMVTVNFQTLNSWAKSWYEAKKEAGDIFATVPGLGAPTISPYLHKTKARAK